MTSLLRSTSVEVVTVRPCSEMVHERQDLYSPYGGMRTLTNWPRFILLSEREELRSRKQQGAGNWLTPTHLMV